MIWLAFARKYAAVLAVAALVALLLYWLSSAINKAEHRGYERAQSEGKSAIAALDAATASREAEEREISRAHDIASLEKTRALQSQIDGLTARNVDLGRLRGCADRGLTAPAGATPAAAEPDGAAGKRIDDLQAEQIFAIQLVRYAGECEQYRQRLSALQDWVSEGLARR